MTVMTTGTALEREPLGGRAVAVPDECSGRAVHTVLGTPLGEMVVAAAISAQGAAITHVRLPHGDGSPAEHGPGIRVDASDEPVLAAATEQLTAYLAGDLREFDLPLRYSGSAFQRLVWDGLRQIPYGTTTSYGDLAAALGLDPRTTARAVGAANGANRIAVVVPCHRVIGASGALTGFAAGVERKRELLDLEARVAGAGALFDATAVRSAGRAHAPGAQRTPAARSARPRRPVDNRRLF